MATMNPLAQLLRGGATPDPGLAASVQDLQTRQMMAQALLQQSQQQVPAQMVGGHYVRPNAGQVIANALSGISGYSMMNDTNKQAAELMRQQQAQEQAMFGIGQPTGPHPGQMQPGQMQGMGQPQAMGYPQGQVNQSAMPLIPGMSPQQSYMIAQRMGMPAYLKLALEQQAPTDIQRNLMAAGYQPGTPEFQRALGTSINKPIQVEGMLVDPVTGQPTFSAPRDGMQYRMDENGNATAIPVQGYAQIQAQNAGMLTDAQERARAGQDIVTVDVPGGTQQTTRANAAASLGAQPGVGFKPSQDAMEASDSLSRVRAETGQILSSIDGILNHKGLPGSVGLQFGASLVPGTPEADFVARHDQLRGQVFLQGFQQLKGGGAITEKEGEAAERAIARLSRTQSEREYKAALEELRGIAQAAQNRATEKARRFAPPGVNGVDSQRSQEAGRIQDVTSAQQFQSLPSGSLFRAPDGSIRRKP